MLLDLHLDVLEFDLLGLGASQGQQAMPECGVDLIDLDPRVQ